MAKRAFGKCNFCGEEKLGYTFRWAKGLKNDEAKGKFYCLLHYSQMLSKGYCSVFTIRTKNEIITDGNICRIILRNPRGEVIGESLVDKEDIDLVGLYRWGKDTPGYANSKKGRMHNLLMPKKEGYVIDHINGNGLDNRRANLRYATHTQNIRNQYGKKHKLQNRGVRKNEKGDKWVADIMVNRKHINLGVFNTRQEAVDARIKAEQEHFGEFAPRRD